MKSIMQTIDEWLKGRKSEKRISFLNTDNINKVLSENWNYKSKENFAPNMVLNKGGDYIIDDDFGDFDGNIKFKSSYCDGSFKVNSFKAN